MVFTGALVYFSAGTFTEQSRESFFKLLISVSFVAALAVVGAGVITGDRFQDCYFLFPPSINYTAVLVAAGAAAAFSMLADPDYNIRYKRLMWVFWLFMVVALVLMRSRSALVGLGSAMAVVLVMRARWRTLAGGLAVIAIAALLIPSAWRGFLLKTDDAFAYQRPAIWKTALGAAWENPLVGVGPNRFERYFLTHQFPAFDGFAYYGRYTNFAHSQPLQAVAETGVIGAVLYLWFILAAMLKTRRAAQPQLKTLAAAVSLFAAALFSEIMFLPVIFALFMLLLGMCGPLEESDGGGSVPCSALTVGLALWLLAGGFAVFRVAAAHSGNPETLAKAAVIYPYDAQLWYRRALAEAAARPSSIYRAQAFMGRAVKLYPPNAVYLYRLAGLMLASGDAAMARTVLEYAAKLEPNSPTLAFALARVHAQLGDMPAARAQYARGTDSMERFGGFKDKSGYAKVLLRPEPGLLKPL